MRRRDVLSLVVGSIGGLTGCVSEFVGGGKTNSATVTADCSHATIDSVELTPSTAGDTIIVRGTVSERPAPDLRGFVINTEGSEKHRDVISEPLALEGEFSREFSFPHHSIKEYTFWLEGCPEQTPTIERTG